MDGVVREASFLISNSRESKALIIVSMISHSFIRLGTSPASLGDSSRLMVPVEGAGVPTKGCVPIVAGAGGAPEGRSGFDPSILSSLRHCLRSLTGVKAVLAVLLIFGALTRLGAAPEQSRPNFLLLLSDDQTYRALGRLGEWPVKTPNLDRLAKRGLLFTHCFNQGGYSAAVCIPSRAMVNTGRYLWQCRGASGQGLAEGSALWGETLGQAGYDTFMAGKWHLPEAALKRSFKTLGPLTGGFLPSTESGAEAYHRPAPGNPWTPDDPKWKGHWLNVDGQTMHSSVRIADAAIGYLRERAGKSAPPFFMYVAFNAPHDPRQAPGKFLELYPPARLKVPPNFLPQHPFPIEADFGGRDEILAPYPRTPEIIRVHLQEYYAIITHMDAEIGRILDALETTGKADNTVVIFTSDQGLAVGQHGLLGKQNLYEHSIRMPFILAGPGIPSGKRNDALFHMQSLFATTCEMAGVPVPASVQFPSLVPLITGRKKQLHSALYGAFLNRQRSVCTERWKLIRTPQAGEVQLFDVKNDPWEMRNLAAIPKHAKTLGLLDARLQELMREMDDPMLPGMTNPQEYFAETTEAFFSRNDFFPFTREELRRHDPEMAKLLERVWTSAAPPARATRVKPPPPELRAPAFYKKYLDADGYPIVASEKVNDYALEEAAYLINRMLAKRPDVRSAMVKSGSRLCIIASREFTTDLPG